jgi:hypothetical protein
MAGRPTKLTPELRDAIAIEIIDGMPLSRVGWLFELDPTTIYGWMRRGKKEPRTIYGQFFLTIKKAQAEFEKTAIAAVRAGGKKWTSFAWMLERRIAVDYAKRDQVNLAKVNDRIKALERELRAAKTGKKA